MHLVLGRTGSGSLTMELMSTVHVAEQWRHGEVQKKKKKEKEKGKGKGVDTRRRATAPAFLFI